MRPPDGQASGIRTSVIDPGRPVGPHPNPRRPPPGTKKVRRGPGRLNRTIQVRDAPGKRRREWDDVQVWDFVRSGGLRGPRSKPTAGRSGNRARASPPMGTATSTPLPSHMTERC